MSLRHEDLDRDKLVELRDTVARMSVAERDALAERMMEAGASGTIFEWMYRGGWRPNSQRMGDGIEGGELEPEAPEVARRRWLRRKGRRA